MKIIPSDIAVLGEMEPEFIPEPESHLVYVLYNPDNPKVKELIKKCKKGSIVNMASLRDEDGRYFRLNHNFPESILKLKNKKD